ncbi:methyltransferase [Pseudomonas huaxiensis]|uniref:methyltransferase n=1 Tax=Pseudomonas huaxiensis TaxID=2213017 RepID=UPI000DA6ADCE|nr:class I SAM-dependent methyltransferase [Pseudomonas huaxiensis]
MQLTDEQRQTDEALLHLGRRLHADGYRFICATPLTHQRYSERVDSLPARTMREVFGWNRPFEASLLSPDELEHMRQAGIISTSDQTLRSQVRWSTVDGLLLVHSGFPTDTADAVFFGPDSYRFARVVEAHLRDSCAPIEHAVEIGCGTGIGALLIARARRHAQVSALDINPLALRYAAINVALAELGNVVVDYSDVLEGVNGSFDLIVANPPYMLDARRRTYRHGGGTFGEGLSVRMVRESLERLSPGGSLVLYTGVAMVDGGDPFLAALRETLDAPQWAWFYEEIDPDVFGEQLLEPGYERVERIAAVALTVTRRG